MQCRIREPQVHLDKGEDALEVHRDLGVAVHAVALQVVILVHVQPIPVIRYNLHTQRSVILCQEGRVCSPWSFTWQTILATAD